MQPGSGTVLADTAIRAADLKPAPWRRARETEGPCATPGQADIAVVEAELAILAARPWPPAFSRQGRTLSTSGGIARRVRQTGGDFGRLCRFWRIPDLPAHFHSVAIGELRTATR